MFFREEISQALSLREKMISEDCIPKVHALAPGCLLSTLVEWGACFILVMFTSMGHIGEGFSVSFISDGVAFSLFCIYFRKNKQ